jgi:integrase
MAISPQVLFEEAIKSPETKRLYNIGLERFKRDTKVNITKKTPAKKLQGTFIEYVIRMKQEARSYSSMNNMVAALQKYCEVLDIEINWKKVRGYMPEHTCNHQDKPYTMEELRKLIEIADPRMKAVILFMLSSGCRVGALPVLRVGDLKRVGELSQVRVYSTSVNDAYTTFCSVEAAKAIDVMLELRRRKGEEITEKSPLFRADIDDEVKPASTQVIHQRIYQLLVKAGIRTPSDSRHKRQGTMLTHSFRKIANTAFVKAGVKPVVVEMLLGHTTGLQANYLRLSDEELLQEYLKAQSLLTISQEKQLLKQVDQLQTDVADLAGLKAIVAKQREEIQRLSREVREGDYHHDIQVRQFQISEQGYTGTLGLLEKMLDTMNRQAPFADYSKIKAEIEKIKDAKADDELLLTDPEWEGKQ